MLLWVANGCGGCPSCRVTLIVESCMAIQVELKPSFKVTAAFLTVVSPGDLYFAVWLPTVRK